MSKAEACKTLHVAPTADAEIVTQAYWHLARKYQAEARKDRRARQRLDELNQAFSLLHPTPESAPTLEEPPVPPAGPPLAEEFVAWLRRLVEETTARWPGHVPEVAILAATTVALASIALSAGASTLWTLLIVAVAALTIWAPWRRI